jgi:hypothetical protein
MVRDCMTDDPIVSPMRGFPTASDTIAPLDHRTRLPDWVQPHSVQEHSPAFAVVELARVITIALVVTAGLLLTPRFAAAGDDPADFIRILGNQGLAVIRSGANLDQKVTISIRCSAEISLLPRYPALFLVRIGALRAGRNGGSSAASSKTILCTTMVSSFHNMAAKASG